MTVFTTVIDAEGVGPRFEQQRDMPLDDACCFEVSLARNSLWTFSTLRGAKKGAFGSDRVWKPPEGISKSHGCAPFEQPAASTGFPFPYFTDFRDWDKAVRFHDFPVYLSDLEGVFRVCREAGTLTQKLVAQPSDFKPNKNRPPAATQEPITVLGDKVWTDYTVSTRARLAAGALDDHYVAVYARFGHGFSFKPGGGYAFRLFATGAWNITVMHADETQSALASGQARSLGGEWRELAMSVAGSQISASIDGIPVGHASSSEWPSGLAGLGCGWHAAHFATLGVSRAAGEVLSV